MPGVIQTIRAELDRASIREIHSEITAIGEAVAVELQDKLDNLQGDEAGKRAAEEALRAIKKAFDADISSLQKQVADGLMQPAEFERRAIKAAQRFSAAVAGEVTKIGADPRFTVNPFKALKLDPKEVDRVGADGRKLGDAWVAGVLDGASDVELPTPTPGDTSGAGTEAGQETADAYREAVEAAPAPVAPSPDAGAAQTAGRDAGEAVGDAIDAGVRESPAPETAAQKAKEAAEKWVEGIVAETRRRRAEIKLAQSEGLLSPEEAKRQGDEVARRHNRAILDGVRSFRQRGDFTPEVLGIFTGAFERVEDRIPPESFWTRIHGKIRTRLLGIGASIAGFFTLRALGRFGASAFGEAVADERAFTGLEAQVDATGASFTRMSGRIEEMARSFADRGVASAGQFARGLSELIAVSGDAEKSLGNMGIAADFARKHQITFEQAIDLVGRAMVGQVTGLKRYGIVVKEGDDAVVAMAESLRGFNSDEAPGMGVALNRLTIAWGDLKGGIGETLIEAGGGTSAIDTLTTALRDGVKYVREHKEEIVGLARAIAQLAVAITRDGLRAIADFSDRSIVEFAQIRGAISSTVAWIEEILAKLADLKAAFREATAEAQDFLGADEAAADSRERARQYREQAEALRQVAEANRDAARSEKERADNARRRLRERVFDTGGSHGAADRAISRMGRDGDGETGPDRQVGGAVNRVGDGRDSTTDALDKRIALLAKATQFERTRFAALTELGKIETEVTNRLAAGNLKLDQRIDLEEKLATIQGVRDRLLEPLGNLGPATTLDAPKMATRTGEPGEDLLAPEARRAALPPEPTPAEAKVWADNYKSILHGEVTRMVGEIGAESPPIQLGFADDLIYTFFTNLEDFAYNSAEGIVETFEDVFSRIGSEALSVNQVLGQLGKGMAQSILREIAAMAKGKAIENVAIAIEETAKGFAALASFNPGAASLHFKAAGTAALAAVKWGLVAGGVGALAGGQGGAGGGGASREGESDDSLKNKRGTVTFFIKGGLLDTDNQEQMDALAAGIAAVSDKDIVVRRS
jgi:hypothetical protein